MRVLIGILSCGRDREYHQKVRATWLKDCPVDYKFVLGKGQPQLSSDEVVFDVSDNNWGCYEKTRALVGYALREGYDYLFKCDIDSYVHVPRLLASGFEQHEFSGYQGCYGGSGYWVNRRCMELLLSSENTCQFFRSEDGWVLRSLAIFGVEPFQDPRYHSLTKEGPSKNNDLITVHWYADWKGSEESSRRIRAAERLGLMEEYFKIAQEIE
jgi:hypothetical protein